MYGMETVIPESGGRILSSSSSSIWPDDSGTIPNQERQEERVSCSQADQNTSGGSIIIISDQTDETFGENDFWMRWVEERRWGTKSSGTSSSRIWWSCRAMTRRMRRRRRRMFWLGLLFNVWQQNHINIQMYYRCSLSAPFTLFAVIVMIRRRKTSSNLAEMYF